MRALVWICLLVAFVATGILGTLAFRGRPEPPPKPAPAQEPPPPPPLEPPEEVLRPYETTVTLTEDLRDALAGPPEALEAEVRRVSERLATKARWVLLNAAPHEASPRVRALLVIAAGCHVPDDEVLLAFLADRAAVVRSAAALAAGRREGAAARHALLEGVEVPIGRALGTATRHVLEERLRREEDEGVRGTLRAVLNP